MPKLVKLAFSIFIGADIFVLAYLLFSQGRIALFGTGDIPGGGSALDMALFLIPAFIGYVSGDRLYHFLTYNERRQKSTQKSTASEEQTNPTFPEQGVNQSNDNATIWQDAGWDDNKTNLTSRNDNNNHPNQSYSNNKTG